STIKRMLGKVSDQHEPSLVTLDTLSQFLGYRHWQDFVNRSSECDGEVSQFLNKDVVMCSDLNEGDMVEITWSPARLCRMRCVGLGRFEVTMSINSKLAEGDTISCQMLAVGQPFTATNVRRGTRLEKVYVAATDGGISSIKLLPRPI
ncbi:MAG: hypothetical protein IK092_00175, partial [Muribaculaceae bacterium]|nr:hypothetical protein [Muribaculaceae bacterium]